MSGVVSELQLVRHFNTADNQVTLDSEETEISFVSGTTIPLPRNLRTRKDGIRFRFKSEM